MTNTDNKIVYLHDYQSQENTSTQEVRPRDDEFLVWARGLVEEPKNVDEFLDWVRSI